MAIKFEQIHLFVSGRVQGVGFRYATLRAAANFGVTGWVRNMPDGKVEIWVEGQTAEINRFLEWCRQGPLTAAVDTLSIEHREKIDALTSPGFEVRY